VSSLTNVISTLGAFAAGASLSIDTLLVHFLAPSRRFDGGILWEPPKGLFCRFRVFLQKTLHFQGKKPGKRPGPRGQAAKEQISVSSEQFKRQQTAKPTAPKITPTIALGSRGGQEDNNLCTFDGAKATRTYIPVLNSALEIKIKAAAKRAPKDVATAMMLAFHLGAKNGGCPQSQEPMRKEKHKHLITMPREQKK
jgi:hypothetical protein